MIDQGTSNQPETLPLDQNVRPNRQPLSLPTQVCMLNLELPSWL